MATQYQKKKQMNRYFWIHQLSSVGSIACSISNTMVNHITLKKQYTLRENFNLKFITIHGYENIF